jgi:hypothetical protein
MWDLPHRVPEGRPKPKESRAGLHTNTNIDATDLTGHHTLLSFTITQELKISCWI